MSRMRPLKAEVAFIRARAAVMDLEDQVEDLRCVAEYSACLQADAEAARVHQQEDTTSDKKRVQQVKMNARLRKATKTTAGHVRQHELKKAGLLALPTYGAVRCRTVSYGARTAVGEAGTGFR